MLWGIASSIFVIYLYRSLNAVEASPSSAPDAPGTAIGAALADLNKRIDALERCVNVTAGEPRP